MPDIIAGNERMFNKSTTKVGISTSTKGIIIKGIVWTDLENGEIMNASDKYEEGKKYRIKIMFVANDGYEFTNLTATVID